MSHSGLLQYDLDKGVEDAPALRDRLARDVDWLAAVWLSVRGQGLCVLAWSPGLREQPEHHKATWEAGKAQLEALSGVRSDPIPAVSQPRYVSWDPDLRLREAPAEFAVVERRQPRPRGRAA